MLGSFSSRSDARDPIADPFGGDLETFMRTYGVIADAIPGLCEASV